MKKNPCSFEALQGFYNYFLILWKGSSAAFLRKIPGERADQRSSMGTNLQCSPTYLVAGRMIFPS